MLGDEEIHDPSSQRHLADIAQRFQALHGLVEVHGKVENWELRADTVNSSSRRRMSSAMVVRTSRSKSPGISSSISSSSTNISSSSGGAAGGGGTRRRRRRTGRRSMNLSMTSPRRRRMVSVTARPFSLGLRVKTPPRISLKW